MPLRRGPSPRYKIKTLSIQLRKLSSPISVKLATFAADAFEKFLSQKCHSLDEAFGITKDRGAHRKLSKAKQHLALARKISALRYKGKSWYQIQDELGQDAGALRRIYKTFRVRLMYRKLRPSLDLPPRATPKSKPTNEQILSEQERWAAWKKQNDKDWATYLRSTNDTETPSKKSPRAKQK